MGTLTRFMLWNHAKEFEKLIVVVPLIVGQVQMELEDHTNTYRWQLNEVMDGFMRYFPLTGVLRC